MDNKILATKHAEWYASHFKEIVFLVFKDAFEHGFKHGAESEFSRHERNTVFVAHVANHLVEQEIQGKVMCKFCNKDIDEIHDEELKYK